MILKSYPDAAALLPPADNWRFRSYNKPVPTGDLVSMIFSDPEQATALALKIVNVRGSLTPDAWAGGVTKPVSFAMFPSIPWGRPLGEYISRNRTMVKIQAPLDLLPSTIFSGIHHWLATFPRDKKPWT